jgi:hypothetical protein
VNFVKCLTAWFQIKKTSKLLLKKRRRRNLTNTFKSFRKRDRSFYNKKSLTAIRQFTELNCQIRAATSSASCEDLTELIFSMDQRINHFFRCVYHFVISLNAQNTLWFLLLITWWILWLFLALLHILRAHLASERLSAVLWVNFCGYLILLVWYILKQLLPFV